MRRNTLFDYMLAALSDKIMILLSSVAIISLALGLYEDFGPHSKPDEPRIHWVEGFSILMAVVLIVFAASLNDLQKESKFRKLNDKKEDRSVKGIRNGETQLISIYDLLVGDILLMEPGDILAADGVLITGMGLKCDESSATGESDAIKKSPEHESILLSGSQVTEGMGKYVVTNVGEDSFFGKILMAMRTEMEDTPLQVKLDGLAERIAKFGAAGAVFMFIVLLLKYVIGVLKSNGFGELPNQENGAQVASQILKIIMQSVAVIAIAVPEGLPLAVTLALAYATTRMMKDNNLVRVISACETMGNATTICSDKTGTLTQNRMTVVTGIVGKNVMFEGEEEVEGLLERIKTLPKDNSHDSNFPLSGAKVKQPGFSGEVLFERIMEGVSVNSSVFETKDKSGLSTIIGSKTETALVEWALKSGVNYKTIRDAPNTQIVQIEKTMATIVKVQQPGGPPVYRIHVKGASEIVLKLCDRIALLPFSASKVAAYPTTLGQPLAKSSSDHSLSRPLDAIPAVGSRSNPASPIFAQNSLRTICLAFREFSVEEYDALINGPLRERGKQIKSQKDDCQESVAVEVKHLQPTDAGNASETKSFESLPNTPVVEDTLTEADLLAYSIAFTEVFGVNLICAAIVGIEDPLRAGVEEAVKTCQKAGVCVRMVTGDNLTTALSIAKKCGIYQKGGIAMEGVRFRQLTTAERELVLPRLQVLARSSPTDKQLLVSSLKSMGDIVAVTGDGTNDGPALKMADVGFSMGIAGTEVAKEASSIILMDDSFSSVVKAIIWGRCVNDSVKKFLQFQLSVNVSAPSLGSSFCGQVWEILTVLQVNLVIDTLAALALGTEKPMADVLDRHPETRTAPLINLVMWKMILGQALLQVIVNLSLLFGGATFFEFHDLIAAGGILGISADASPEALYQRALLRTVVFNTFVLMLMFNEVNCRRINSNLNIFSGIFDNPFFGCIFVGVFCIQALIVQFGGVTFQTTPLNGAQWAFCILVGFTSIPWGLIIRLIPNDLFPQGTQVLPNTNKSQFVSMERPSLVALTKTNEEVHQTGSPNTPLAQTSSHKLKSLESLRSCPIEENGLPAPSSTSNSRFGSDPEVSAVKSLSSRKQSAYDDVKKQFSSIGDSQTGSLDGSQGRASGGSNLQQQQQLPQAQQTQLATTGRQPSKTDAPPVPAIPQRGNTVRK
ncbi:PMCA-type calcium-translocating P-type ATPase [Obelidium mucronatum]|nr:PMCA-type calcium-translocating P-type ATPase [Obelidium mucronatum]